MKKDCKIWHIILKVNPIKYQSKRIITVKIPLYQIHYFL